MSTFEKENDAKYPNPNTVPMRNLEKAYWRRKMPRSLRFYLEGVSRELMLSQPEKLYPHAANFFEELLSQRNAELKMLPQQPYLDKLMRKRGIERPEASPEPPPPLYNPVRCARCGRWLNPQAHQQTDAGPAASHIMTHMDGDEECRVIVLPLAPEDVFGRLYAHTPPPAAVPGGNKGSDEELFNTRSLSFLVDY